MPLPADPAERIRRARCGDRVAIGELWQAHQRFVATVLLAHGSGRELDDLLQEVALRFTRAIGELDDPARLRSWLRRIACNVAVDHGRRTTLAPPALQVVPAEDGDREPTTDCASRRLHQEDLEQTLRDLDRLDPAHREVLLLRAVDGMSQQEIAQALDVPETTVETRLARARRWLRERRDELDRATTHDHGERHAPLRRTVD